MTTPAYARDPEVRALRLTAYVAVVLACLFGVFVGLSVERSLVRIANHQEALTAAFLARFAPTYSEAGVLRHEPPLPDVPEAAP